MLTPAKIGKIKKDMGDIDSRLPLIFQALGDPGRFNIFKLLAKHRDICVSDVAKIFGITISAASQQLKVMERVGLVRKTRMGQMICYEIKGNSLTRQITRLFKNSREEVKHAFNSTR